MQSTRIPNYIDAKSLEAKRWKQTHPRAKLVRFCFDNRCIPLPIVSCHSLLRLPSCLNRNFRSKKIVGTSIAITAHTAAAAGDLDVLTVLVAENPESIKKVDANGWTPLHEAVRIGSIEVIDYLIKKGLDINQRTHGGNGGSPLWWAKAIHGENHKVVEYLKKKGAEDIPPDDE